MNIANTNSKAICSGMLVQDPNKRNDVDEIFNQARQLGGVELVPSLAAPDQPQNVGHNIVFWRNGFTMKIIKPLDMRNYLYSLGNNKGRLIGLDVGKFSMGVSMSDSHLQVAEPLRIISRNAKEGVTPANIQLQTIISTGISGFVVGLPTYKLRKIDSTLIVETFVNGLAKTGDFSNLNICYWDAVGTAKNASLLLDHIKLPHTELKDIGEKLATAGILQGFLDFYNNPDSKPWVGVMESDSE